MRRPGDELSDSGYWGGQPTEAKAERSSKPEIRLLIGNDFVIFFSSPPVALTVVLNTLTG
jgi:hypothetical protein